MTLDKFFDEIDEADLRQLIDNRMSGCNAGAVEYKECLPDDSYESQKEFLAEVCSFANTNGGHLLYGVRQEDGLPAALPGISARNPDREVYRLEKLLKDYLQPRCQGVTIRVVEMTSTHPILVIRIPESWSKPHVVNFEGHWRFYARNSLGKYPLGITELKSALLAATGLGERIRSFRFDRLSRISADKTPVPLVGKARTVFHLIPYSAFESSLPLRFAAIEDIWSIPLMYTSASSYHYNLDGLILYSEKGEGNCSQGYTQVFWNGILESVNANVFGSSIDGPYLPSLTFETDMTAFLNACIAFYKRQAIHMPAALLISLVGVRDCELARHQHLDTWHNHVNRIDMDSLLLPEVVIEDAAVNPTQLLKPVFNAIWKSMGWERLYGGDETTGKKLIFPREEFVREQMDVSRRTKAKRQ